MRRVFFIMLSGIAVCLGLSAVVLASGRNAADYPLRVHIFQFNSHSHYYRAGGYGGMSSLDSVDGEGRANLYEDSIPHGVDFSYHCGERLMVSPGYETYPARWLKPGRTLEILEPQFGKPGAYEVCELKVELKETVYFKHGGLLDEEPAAKFKDWMDKHQYDPEKGKNEPVATAPTAVAPAGTGAGSAAGSAPLPTQAPQTPPQ